MFFSFYFNSHDLKSNNNEDWLKGLADSKRQQKLLSCYNLIIFSPQHPSVMSVRPHPALNGGKSSPSSSNRTQLTSTQTRNFPPQRKQRAARFHRWLCNHFDHVRAAGREVFHCIVVCSLIFPLFTRIAPAQKLDREKDRRRKKTFLSTPVSRVC